MADNPECPLSSPEAKEWTPQQSSVADGPCHFCTSNTTLRHEPFSGELACKTCWELICYGDDD